MTNSPPAIRMRSHLPGVVAHKDFSSLPEFPDLARQAHVGDHLVRDVYGRESGIPEGQIFADAEWEHANRSN
jgi:hypothetical protein